MSKRFLLSAVAVSVIASVASAGTLGDYNSSMIMNDTSASSEYLKQLDLNNSHQATLTVPLNGYYKPSTIKLGSLKNPVLNIKFTHVRSGLTSPVSVNSHIVVCEVNSSGQYIGADAAGTPFLKYKDTTSDGFSLVASNADIYVSNNKVYQLVVDNDANCSNGTDSNLTLVSQDVNVTFDAGDLANSSGSDVQFTLGTGDSQEVQDTASGNVVKVGTELCCSVNSTTNLKASIDPSKDFLQFVAAACGNAALSSSLRLDCKELGVNGTTTAFTNRMGKVNAIINLVSDKALPLDENKGIVVTDFSGTTVANENIQNTDDTQFLITEKDQTVNSTTVNATRSTNITLTVDGKTKIPVTNFTVSLGLDLDKDGNIDLDKIKDAKAGSWTYSGTTLTTPYVSANADTQTILRINNNSSQNAQVYWSCYDDNGNSISLVQVNKYKGTDAALPAHSSGDWLGSDILAAMQNINPDFASDNKMKCSATITDDGTANGLEIMTINGARDRVIPFN